MDNASVEILYSNTEQVCYDENNRRYTDEMYRFSVLEAGEGLHVKIRCAGEKAAFYALCEINERLRDGTLSAGEYVNAPAFAVRGYIEGFYGTPWTHDQRLNMMLCMAKHRMNTVYYAPKDDIYHREKWRDLYPAEELEKLRELLGTARSCHMDLYWCLAPGLSIRYTSPADFSALLAKYEQLYSAGFRRFGLLLDDIGETLAYSEDAEAYAEPVNAHIDLICRVYDALKKKVPGIRLTVCPTQYNGRGDEYYISKLGQNIPPEVSLFWTGRDICSREIGFTEALKFTECTCHRPLYWDNYPVNDEAMLHEMHLGPLIGRDKELHRFAGGLISNCMQYAECSKIPLITAADYLWNGPRYDPESAWKKAVAEVVGDQNASSFLLFADQLRTSCLRDENAPELAALFHELERACASGDAEQIDMKKSGYLLRARECLLFLERDLPICRELARWTKKFRFSVQITEKLLGWICDKQNTTLKNEIETLIEAYERDPAVCVNAMLFREVLLNRFAVN